MAKYYYRFSESSDLGIAFRSLLNAIDKANDAADAYTAKMGGKFYYNDMAFLGGGVVALSFEDESAVDKKIWRCIGPDEGGVNMWVPRVEQESGVMVLPRKTFRPSDTASRIYSKRILRWGDVRHLYPLVKWMMLAGVEPTGDKEKDAMTVDEKMQHESFVRFVEVKGDPELMPKDAKNGKKRRMPWHITRAICIEVQRMKLPLVGLEDMYNILKSVTEDDGKPQRSDNTTPLQFRFCTRYYIGVNRKCTHPDLEPITQDLFLERKIAFEKTIRELERLRDAN